ncbi:hypothetical protein Ocin01_13344 [Orchesella cincta]|uniref:Tudor domain-containing protein n=1 Tax=Orchesella cincta TaxID=48709 RepID=A0A1D2MJT6_ORCCI|nr:hypothetical protein Ocin01_13344 [Orchesella cincta]
MSSTPEKRGLGRGRGRAKLTISFRSRSPSPETITGRRLPPPPDIEEFINIPQERPSSSLQKELNPTPTRSPPEGNVKEDDGGTSQPGLEDMELKLAGEELADSVSFFKSVKREQHMKGYNSCLLDISIPEIPESARDDGILSHFCEAFGDDDDTEKVEEEQQVVKKIETVKFPTKFVIRDGRYFLEDEGQGRTILPERGGTYCELLFMDKNDVWYVRPKAEVTGYNKKNHIPPSKKNIAELLFDLEVYYGVECWTEETFEVPPAKRGLAWYPKVGEVVVVRIARKNPVANLGYVRKIEFQRARVLGLMKHGARVELLDDFGEGGISFANIFEIRPEFVMIPPQMFTCELADMELLSNRKIVHSVLSECSLPDKSWIFRLEFRGKYSDVGLALVNVYTELSVDLEDRMDVKNFVLKNASNVLSPYNHLLNSSATCRAIRGDSDANLWLHFDDDRDLREIIYKELERVRPSFDSLYQLCSLSVANILSHDENWERVYVAELPDIASGSVSRLCRVKLLDFMEEGEFKDEKGDIHKVYEKTVVIVDNMDVGTTHAIYPSQLLPLSVLSPDLCYIPPLALLVHLKNVKDMQHGNERVRNLLLNKELRVVLIYEWPDNIFPPEIAVYPTDDDELEKIPNDNQHNRVSGLGLVIVNEKLGSPYSWEDRKLAKRRMQKLQKFAMKTESTKQKDLYDNPKFTGDMFQFDV